ncbi:MAG: right-handed parallel beta-helix repeat-containing protein, partial [Promethearchaeota archaeon]
MKSNIKIVLFTLGMLFLFSIMFKAFSDEEINHIEFNDGKDGIRFYEEIPNKLKQSASWNLTGILINNNWASVNATYDWCNGAGTESDPYIIENVTIDAQGSDSCIEIRNSNDYFIIQNCILYNSGSLHYDAGITLRSVINGKIVNNYCDNNQYGLSIGGSNNTISGNAASNNSQYGISLSGNNNIVSENTANNNFIFGIYLSGNYNLVSGNNVSNNGWDGIYLGDSFNNVVSGNNASDNRLNGIRISESINNLLSNNIANYNDDSGIHLIYDSYHNIISGNTASYNSEAGMYLSFTVGNTTISGNTANNNGLYGIRLYKSSNNKVSENNVSDNINEGIRIY